jgi:hypothetical protein
MGPALAPSGGTRPGRLPQLINDVEMKTFAQFGDDAKSTAITV